MRINRMFKLTGNAVFLLTLLSMTGCATSAGGYISGQVVDAVTNQPISNAAVMIKWEGEEFAYVESRTVCVNVDSTFTDEDGRFQFPLWIKITNPLIGSTNSHIYVFMKGYTTSTRDYKKNIFSLTSFQGSVENRLQLLQVQNRRARCEVAEEKLIPYKKSVYREANELAKSREGWSIANNILYEIERLELGEEEADRRFEKRRPGIK